MTHYQGEEWYPAAWTGQPCKVCGCNQGDTHPFSREAVHVDLYVKGDLWQRTRLLFLAICRTCLELSETKVIQGRLL